MSSYLRGPWHRIGRPVDTVLACTVANDGPFNSPGIELIKDAQSEFKDLRAAHDALTADNAKLRGLLAKVLRWQCERPQGIGERLVRERDFASARAALAKDGE